ncbi:unnamed protein product, partial [Effrenium voratum]
MASAVLVRNGRAGKPWLSKHELLHNYSGAYTTARTVKRSAVFELSMHCQRLVDTASSVLQRAEASEKVRRAQRFLELGPEALRPVLRSECRTALQHLEEEGDFQITILLTCDTASEEDERGFDMFTFMQPLPFVEATVEVEAHRADRSNPTIKDVQWVNDRQQLEEIIQGLGVQIPGLGVVFLCPIQGNADINEVVMYDAHGCITEGLQTNFFASRAGTLFTAPDERVLSGTVRKVVLDVARENGIPVRFECPKIGDLDKWDSCFVCSTSRLVKPIRALKAPELGLEQRFELGMAQQ